MIYNYNIHVYKNPFKTTIVYYLKCPVMFNSPYTDANGNNGKTDERNKHQNPQDLRKDITFYFIKLTFKIIRF